MKRLMFLIMVLFLVSSLACVSASENGTQHDDNLLCRNMTTSMSIYTYLDDDSVDVSVIMDERATGDVSFKISNQTASFDKVVSVNKGEASYIQSGLLPGKYDLSALYSGDSLFYPNSASDSFTIEKSNTNLFVSMNMNSDTVSISAEVDKKATGKVLFNITGPEHYLEEVFLDNGKADYTKTLKTGEYTYTVTYTGDNRYNSNSKSGKFSVKKTVDLSVGVSISADKVTFTANLDKGATGEVLFKITGPLKQSKYEDIVNGVSTCKKDSLPFGDYKLYVGYDGDDSYMPVTATTSFSITQKNTKITVKPVSIDYNSGKNIVITLKDSDSNPIKNAKVNIVFNKNTYNIKTNSKGQVKLKTDGLVPDVYDVSAVFTGSKNYFPAEKTSKVAVKKATLKISVKKSDKKLLVSLKDSYGNPVKKIKLKFKVASKTYTAKTNKKGVATFKLSKKGLYNGAVKFKGNNYYTALNKKVKVFI